MAMKLPIPSLPLDKRRMAIAVARLKAWWDGKELDDQAVEQIADAVMKSPASELDLFEDAPLLDDVRLDALSRIWGPGRITPGEDSVDALHASRIGAPATATLAVFGPGLAAPIRALAACHPGPMQVFEWRDETQAALREGLAAAKLDKRVSLACIDLETFNAPKAAFDGLISIDELTYADNAARFVQQAARALKSNAAAVFECYCGAPGPDAAAAFATAFAEPHLRLEQDVLDALETAGFRIDSSEDLTEEHESLARAGFRRLATALKDAAGMDPVGARELSWEAQAWRARVKLLNERRLERRQFLAMRRN
jgi:hypothetical protein